MNAFKRKALTTAVLAGLGAAGTAHAVFQDPNGLGQVLIYPYYTVQSQNGSGFNTYISVVNPTNFTKVVRFRAREGRNSTEVRDFNIYLSPNDVWAAAIIPNSAGGASLITTDNSCTSPVLPTVTPATATQPAVKGIDFTNLLFDPAQGGTSDGAGTGLDRTREGYIEILELARLDPAVAGAGALTVHNPATDTPPCGNNLLEIPAGTPAAAATFQLTQSGGLNGTGTLIHVGSGNAAGYNAVALADVFTTPLFNQAIANDTPNFGAATPVSIVVSNGFVYRSVFTSGIAGFEAVSATMMHNSVINEYVLDTATRSNTDWVLTFPTKRAFVSTTGATTPFTNKFTATGACESISFNFFNREERGQAVASGGFSPGGSAATGGSLCWESTVLSIRNGQSFTPASGATTSGVLSSANVTGVDITAGFQNGWARLTFTGTNASATGLVSDATSTTFNINAGGAPAAGAQTFRGLPVVGFMVRTLQNTAVTCGPQGCNFGGLFPHKYTQLITP